MSLSSTLTNLNNARGALVEAINSKGVTVDASATLYSCVSAIAAIPTGSGGIDVSSTTAETGDVLSPKIFYDSAGNLTTGTIPTVSAAIEDGAVVVPSGYIPTSQSFPVSSGTDPVGNATDGDLLAGKSATISGGSVISGTIPTVSAAIEDGAVVVPSGYIPTSQSFPVSSGTDPVGNATDGDLLAGKSATISGGSVISGTIPTVSATVSGAVVTVPAGYIASAQSISAGTDVSDTTAEAADVLSGKVFYTSGGIMTSGTIPTVSAYTSGLLSDVIVPSGYIATSQHFSMISAYQEMIASTTAEPSDVLTGKRFMDSTGVWATGTILPASSATVAGGIVTIPAGYVSSAYTVSVGSGATDYYRCASVTSGGSTWTGYLAVLSGGVYSFESAVTSGLTYTTVTPVPGKVYADGALIQATLYEGLIPMNGLLVYALPDNSWVSGQSVSAWGNFSQSDSNKQPQLATIGGVTGIKARAGDEMTASASSAITGDFSYIAKFYVGTPAEAGQSFGFLKDNTTEGAILCFGDTYSMDYLLLSKQGVSASISDIAMSSLSTGVHTVAVTFEALTGTVKYYVDGIIAYTDTYEVSFDHSSTFTYTQDSTTDNLILGLAAYNRVLSDAEIAGIVW